MVDTKNLLLGVVTGQLLTFQPYPFTPGFDIQKVASVAQSLPSHSWEFGAAAQALLELHNPSLSVFGSAPFPVPAIQKDKVKALEYAADKIELGNGADGLVNGNGAVGDPASLGVSAVMLGKTDPSFSDAASTTINFLFNSAPRYSNGAISHRASTPELWADFMYMAPPFFAYYAADKGNATLLRETVRQCGLYRQVLQSDTNGVWEHIRGPNHRDQGLWSTGNAWAAAGMARVLATVLKAPIAQNASWQSKAVDDLNQWIKEIIDGAMASDMDGGLVRNYFHDTDSGGHGFGEISGSSLLAAVAYRMVVLQPQEWGNRYIKWADGIRATLSGNDDNGKPHITSKGIVTPAVNPLAWLDTKPFTRGSPEGQAFVVLMYAAWRDCVLDGRCTLEFGSRAGSRRMHKRSMRRNINAGHSVTW
ncbi:Unsaturated rhamnogalacturonyl hydrolase YesR [Hypsizygus marmoreus]|uniref:Unsaturated rhamnogalacturonyl hydrolase YesR n=1 Tax=Hypsizygus marmoreus TaxID=39966 RepID=A0A369JF84_HYPMA|nr:Unsaturated rhamnogalacturonyl hydrolase YesR [Hypsizygus marmoreus]